jgi:hypothetical protein
MFEAAPRPDPADPPGPRRREVRQASAGRNPNTVAADRELTPSFSEILLEWRFTVLSLSTRASAV